ncbi:TasA family protein [Virgibacillus kekensis]|uniref:TasA family protein n=1 Tax=Virgibacillus kekensis TaxID=202261 RepID=A0ABV9DE26_9BACI
MRIITLVIILLFSMLQPIYAQNKTTTVNLSVEPGNVLFDLSNIKPGDSVTRFLTLDNNGTESFDYNISNKFTGGSKAFYNKLELKLKSSQGTLYEGKLKDFTELRAGRIDSQTKEKLTFFVKVPKELTNEFQGLTSYFQFKIYVEGTLGGVLSVDNRLPDTATNMFNYLILGVALTAGGGAMYIYQRRKKLNSKKEY